MLITPKFGQKLHFIEFPIFFLEIFQNYAQCWEFFFVHILKHLVKDPLFQIFSWFFQKDHSKFYRSLSCLFSYAQKLKRKCHFSVFSNILWRSTYVEELKIDQTVEPFFFFCLCLQKLDKKCHFVQFLHALF